MREEIQKIVYSMHSDPFEVLGAHLVTWGGKDAVAIRAFLPDSQAVAAVNVRTGQRHNMKRVHEGGFFEAVIRSESEIFPVFRLLINFVETLCTIKGVPFPNEQKCDRTNTR